MPLNLPQSRRQVRQIQIEKQRVPVEQIIAVRGRSPVAKGIEVAGDVLGQALARKAQLRQQAEQVAQVEKAYGLKEGELSGLPPEMAASVGKNLFDRHGVPRIAGSPESSAEGGYVIPRGVDPATGRPVYSRSKKLGLFYDDGSPYKGGAPGALTLKAMPSEQVQKESDLSTLQFATDKVSASYDPKFVGPIGSRIGKGKQFVEGMATPEATDFYSNVADLRNQLVYLRSGKAINEEEYKRLLAAIPNENMSPTDFARRMGNFKQLLQVINQSRQQTLSGTGYRTPPKKLSPLPAATNNDPLGIR